MYILHNSRVWKEYQSDYFVGYSPVAMKTGVPNMLWRGGKIPMELWQTILAFFLENKAAEVQLRLFYNIETREWRAHAFPQRYPTGMTTDEIADHPNMAVDLALFPHPWAYMGTVHHHCSSSAFQSGTDHGNEKDIVGIHITVGNLDKDALSIHGRVCVKFPGELDGEGKVIRSGYQEFYDAVWSNWFQLPPAAAAVLPERIHDNILQVLLCTPVGKEVGFPARWSENLIRFCQPTTHYTFPNAGLQWDNQRQGYYSHVNNTNSAPVSPSRGSGTTIRTRTHATPRSAQNLASRTRAIQEARKVPYVRNARDSGFDQFEHEWLFGTVLGLMEPMFDGPKEVGNHVDLTACYGALEVDNEKDAETIATKLGFVQTLANTWCHPNDLNAINRAIGHMAEEEAARLQLPD